MNEIDFLDKQLTIEGLDELLTALMGYSVYQPEHPSPLINIKIRDEDGNNVPFYDLIGHKDITIVRNVLFLKEKIDERRGEQKGRYDVQKSIKQTLGID